MKFYIFFICFFYLGAYANPPKRLSKPVTSTAQPNKAPVRQAVAPPSQNSVEQGSLHVDYSRQPVFLDRGQEIHPLCNNPATLDCVAQWSQQAVPLVSKTGGSLPPTTEYYLPGFVPNSESDNAGQPINEKVWELVNSFTTEISKYDSEDSSDDNSGDEVKFYRDRNNPDKVRRVSEDSDEEGNIVYIPESSISRNADQIFIKIGTHVFSSTTEEVQDGCFVIQKQSQETEAGYCAVCSQSKESIKVLNEVGVDLESLNTLLEQVDRGSSRNISTKIGSQGSYTEKICSPKSYLQSIINNFNKNCGMSFEDFFEKSYCASCSEKIPIELMMSIMSVESAGNCKAYGTSGVDERSVGLFQININTHKKCVEIRNIKNSSLQQCLNHPVNNLMSSVEILKESFKQVNPHSAGEGLKNTTDQCREGSSWLEFSSKEKDYWRRAVSAYNGGPLWVTRSLASAMEYKRVKQGTGFLRKNLDHSSYKEQDIPWESLRQLYFLEKLAPSNNLRNRRNRGCGIQTAFNNLSGGTGRQVSCTISNLAYVEAILGRDTATSQPPLIEIWHQYKLKFLKERGGALQCGK